MTRANAENMAAMIGLTAPVRNAAAKHDHAVCVYGSEKQLFAQLEHFLRGGLAEEEITTFVHAFTTPDVAWEKIALRVPGGVEHVERNELLLSHHRQAFERDGSIDHAHAAGVVGALIAEARARGRAGTRVFVDASKGYLDAGRTDEWFAFESWLAPRLDPEVALVCAYDARHLRDPDVLARVLATHAYRFEGPPEIHEV